MPVWMIVSISIAAVMAAFVILAFFSGSYKQ